jgi:DNA-binding transcriptional regulator YiaG
MSGAELRAIRHQLGLTLQGFAPQLGIHWNTLARFERDEINISGPVEKLARLLLELAEAGQQRKPKQRSRKKKVLEK